jgi:nucleoside-diphosphate-sugar epimerase
MRVFVTGAAEFIGTETTKELIANGHRVVGLARSEANVETLKNWRGGSSRLAGGPRKPEERRKGFGRRDPSGLHP